MRKSRNSRRLAHGRYVSVGVASTVIFVLWAGTASAGGQSGDALAGIEFGVKAYVDYSFGQMPSDSGGATADYNRFKLTRGYFTVQTKMLSWMGMRLTVDVTQDGTGDYKVRQKYFYADLHPRDVGPFTNMTAEIGMGHMPWLDFEEHINPYRSQGTMAIERAGTFNSADVGLSLRGEFGGHLLDARPRTGSDHYTGRYGSWHLGVYNGGGYHAEENNENKVLEGRVTVRPLPDIIPGLQVSYLGIFGEGNSFSDSLGTYPDYMVNLGMLSFEHPRFVAIAQVFTTQGNAKGTWIDSSGVELTTEGFSLFGNLRVPEAVEGLSVFGRLDYFDIDPDNALADKTAYTMILGGVAYELYKGNLVLLTFEVTEFERDLKGKNKLPVVAYSAGDEKKIQAVYQIKF